MIKFEIERHGVMKLVRNALFVDIHVNAWRRSFYTDDVSRGVILQLDVEFSNIAFMSVYNFLYEGFK